MEKEHVDPAYKYIDGKIKLIKHDLQQEILRTQRYIANFIITFTANDVYSTIKRLSPRSSRTSQLIASASATTVKIQTSDDPLSIANEFCDKCDKELEKLGIKLVKLS